MTETRFYRIWCGIKARCENKNVSIFKYYGSRGIQCYWKTFESFYADMFDEYTELCKQIGEPNVCIDRIDVNGHYCKSNTKWTTRYFQVRNRRSNRNYTFNGKTKCLGDWAKEFSIPRNTLMNRLNRGIPIDVALTMKRSVRVEVKL